MCATRPGSALAVVNVLYNVGSRDENRQLTGIAHLFEHLMFGGSANVAEFDAELEAAGGNSNAWTSTDFTNFYEVLPACNLSTAFHLESDRMLALDFSESSLDVQRSVVVEEFKQTCLNRPYGDLMHHLRAMCYDARHPYSWPTIGLEPEHILNTRLDDIRHWFYSHYAPNNAVIAISGNVTLEQARDGLERWFGPIPARDIAPRLYQPEPEVTEPRTVTVTGRVPQPLVVVAYPMAAYGQPGYIESDLLTDVLASGRSSRYYRSLVMADSLFTEADASIAGSEEPGFLMLRGRLTDASPEAVGHAVEALNIYARALEVPESQGGLTQRELERALNRFDSNHRFSMLSCLSRAQELAMAEMHGEDINRRVATYRSVTRDDMVATAARVLDPSRACTLVYLPE